MFVSAGDTEHSLRLKGHSDVKFVLQTVEMLNRQVPILSQRKKLTYSWKSSHHITRYVLYNGYSRLFQVDNTCLHKVA